MGYTAPGFAGFPSVGGSAYNRQTGRQDADRANDNARAMMHEQMEFEERMSNSAHFREMKDLKRAGLNPILTATGGPGASTPSVGQADTFKAEGTGMATSGMEIKRLSQETKLLEKQAEAAASSAELNKATTGKTREETKHLKPKGTIMEKLDQKINEMFENRSDFYESPKPKIDKRIRQQNQTSAGPFGFNTGFNTPWG